MFRLHKYCASGASGSCALCATDAMRVRLAHASMTPDRFETLETLSGPVRRAMGRRILKAAKRAENRLKRAEAEAVKVAKAAKAANRLIGNREYNARVEAERHAEGIARRAARASKRAAKAQAAKIADQSAIFALRASQDATWRVFVIFRDGAHSVSVGRPVEGVFLTRHGKPVQGQESRKGRRWRGDATGLLYREAEQCSDQLRVNLAQAPDRKVKAPRQRKRRRG